MWNGFYEKGLRDRKSPFPLNLIMLNLNLPASPQLQLFWKCEQSRYEVIKAIYTSKISYFFSMHTKKACTIYYGGKKLSFAFPTIYIMKWDMGQPSDDTRALIPNNMACVQHSMNYCQQLKLWRNTGCS